MFDLLYVHPGHPLAAQITFYYRLSGIEKFPWPVDAVASGGMNGFLWLTKRNGLKKVIPSPVYDLEDITNNQAVNITYLNPAPHAHIPKPPQGVNMPQKATVEGTSQGEKDHRFLGQYLGEAAHRLVHNTLNIKSERTNSSNFQGNHDHLGYEMGVSEIQNSPNRHPSAGPSGYGRYGYKEQGQYSDPNAPMGGARFGGPPNNMQIKRPIYNAQDRYSYQEQHHDLRGGMSALTIKGGLSKGRSSAGSSSRSSISVQISQHTSNTAS